MKKKSNSTSSLKDKKMEEGHHTGNKLLFIGFIALVVVAVGITIIKNAIPVDSTEQATPPVKTCKTVDTPYESQEAYMKTEYYTESVPYTDKECENKNIAYSIDNFRMVSNNCNKEQDICNKYFLGICSDKTTFCVDKTISCALELRNLDSEEKGVFTIRFDFYDVGTRNTIKNDDSSNLVYAQTTNTFTGVARVTSEGAAGDANKKLSCSYTLQFIPTKQVCRDVIKYKDVQRERQVTAYRPVTKYRSEEVCS